MNLGNLLKDLTLEVEKKNIADQQKEVLAEAKAEVTMFRLAQNRDPASTRRK